MMIVASIAYERIWDYTIVTHAYLLAFMLAIKAQRFVMHLI